MLVLVLNCGSSSLKYQLIDMENQNVLAKGNCERIGINGSFLKQKVNGEELKIEKDMPTHKVAVETVFEALTDKVHGAIKSLEEINAIGHRAVHGGEYFSDSVLITDEVMEKIKDCIELAPLHNPANIIGIEACQTLLPNVPNVAVFDTAFHQTMPKEAYLYGIPYEYYEKYKVRRYGFHGTSHKYISQKIAEILNKDVKELKTISCHLGSGASMCAIKNGKSIDTTMGFTPLDGIVMGTRSGYIDPAIIEFIMNKENLSISEVINILNKKSGVYGVSEGLNDFRDLWESADKGNEKAKTALDLFCYRVKKCIGEYIAAMNGVDVIVFTAGIGENDDLTRAQVLENMETFGIDFNKEANLTARKHEYCEISTPNSKVKVFVVKTNEELMIAKETMNIIKNN